VQDYVVALERTVREAVPALLALGDETSARRPAPGKWSPREILGHLVDSASNNHRRFVVAQRTDDLAFDGYDPDAWVADQHYQDAPWQDLVTLWASFNRHLARVMAAVPPAALARPRSRHTLHRIAWQEVAENEATSLDYLMRDYVGHLRHHVAQLLDAGRSGGAAR
jgi:hypothetical protein